MGRRRLAWGSWLLALALVLVGAGAALASFESPASNDTSQQFTPGNPQRQDTPNDPDYDNAEPDTQQPPAKQSTNIYDERFDLFGFPSARSTASAHYLEGPNMGQSQVSGYNAAGAWKLTRGRPDVTIAILDTGIKWDRSGLRQRVHLNKGELPLPQGCSSSDYDCNGDGQFNVDDYAGDSRVTHSGPITGEDLIHAFSDGTDADHNGYVDDIAGWDFFDNDNDPSDDSSYFAAKNHGGGRANDAVERGNDASGGLGVCPHCQFVPLRVWDTFVSDGNTFGQAMMYAADRGVAVIEGADGSMYHSAFAEAASEYAYRHGVVQTFSGDDLNTGDHNYPANYSHVMLIQGTVPDTIGADVGDATGAPLPDLCAQEQALCTGTNGPVNTYFRGANTTQYGGKSSIAMEGETGSVNTGKASGAAALVVSAGLSHGIRLRPDETRALLEQTAEDVTAANTVGVGNPDFAQEGWDPHFGWGR